MQQFPDNHAMRLELVTTYLVAPPEAFPNDRDAAQRRAAELSHGDPWLTGILEFRAGLAREKANDLPGMETAFRAAVESFSAAEPESRPPSAPFDLAFARLELARVLAFKRGNLAAARAVLEESAEEQLPRASQSDAPPHARRWLGATYGTLSEVLKSLNDTRAADQATRSAEKYGWVGFGPGGPGGPGGRPFGLWGGPGGWGGKKDGPRKDGPGKN